MSHRSIARALVAMLLAAVAVAVPRAASARPHPTKPDGAPATAPSPALDGVYHVEVHDEKHVVTPALIVVDHLLGQAEVFLILNEATAPLTGLRGDAKSVSGQIDTSEGRGDLHFEVTDRTVVGTLAFGRHVLAITGTRSV
jgi:hypothetical protein